VADLISDKTVGNVLANGFSECYNPDTGEPLRVKNLGMSCTAVTMLLDGFGREYRRIPCQCHWKGGNPEKTRVMA
jgi:hypothetical protein